MTFDEWFCRQFGPRPSSIRTVVQKQAIKEARDRLSEMEHLLRRIEQWEDNLHAARLAWNVEVRR